MALIRVRSPLLTESRLISFLPVTKMFQFTGFSLSIFIKKRFPDRRSTCSLMGSCSLSQLNTSFILSKCLGVPLTHYDLVYYYQIMICLCFLGGDIRTRTGNFLHAKQAVYQLTYIPLASKVSWIKGEITCWRSSSLHFLFILVEYK